MGGLIFMLIVIGCYYGIPIVLIALFVRNLLRYISAKEQNKVISGTFSDEGLKERKKHLIISAVSAGVYGAVLIGFTVLMSIALSHM